MSKMYRLPTQHETHVGPPNPGCCSDRTALCDQCASQARTHGNAVPNAYRAATAAIQANPYLDPNYNPFGTPTNGYTWGLALRALAEERDDTTRTVDVHALRTAEQPYPYNRLNPPDPYATGIARMREEAR